MKGNYIYYSDSDIFYSAQTGIALYIILIGTSAGNDIVATIFIILFFPPTFPDPAGRFGAPWWPFWILQAVRRCRR